MNEDFELLRGFRLMSWNFFLLLFCRSRRGEVAALLLILPSELHPPTYLIFILAVILVPRLGFCLILFSYLRNTWGFHES